MTAEAARRPVAIVSGLSGAGKSTALRALEDLGWETVDNPPLSIVASLLATEGAASPLAIGIDARRADFDPEAAASLVAEARGRADLDVTLAFLVADEETLLRRFTETRRRHPLAAGGRLAEAVQRERELLGPLEAVADVVVDTSMMTLQELRAAVEARFAPSRAAQLWIGIVSFSYARGLPREADLVFDVRFLRNPHYDKGLRPLTGLDPRSPIMLWGTRPSAHSTAT